MCFAQEIWISTVVKLRHKEINTVGNEVCEAPAGLFPVSDNVSKEHRVIIQVMKVRGQKGRRY